MHKQPPNYYSSLDGVRAIAVSIVVLFHAGISYASGGFIGVDIFFVVSGFLITSNILRDLEDQNFSLAKFYTRRATRLLPALFATIILTLVLGYFYLTPNQLSHLAGSALAASLIASNIFFWLDSGYFAPDTESLPLLHTWSLGIEEQFYLFWPIFLLVFLSRIRKQNAVLIVAGLWLLSALISYIAYERNASAVFYLLPFRVQEFALGAIIAFRGELKSGSLQAIVAILSLWLIGFITITVNGSYDGVVYEMILPSLAAAGLIFGAASQELKPILSSSLLVWIGKRSYSIYLVHWPIGVFLTLAFMDIRSNSYYALIVIVLSLVFGYLLHQFVEQRFRLKAEDSSQKYSYSLRATSVFLMLVLGVSVTYRFSNGLPQRLSPEIRIAANQFDSIVSATNIDLNREACEITSLDVRPEEFDVGRCLPFTGRENAYLVLGDSLAANAYLVFKNAYPEIEFGLLTIPGCPLSPPNKFPDRANEACKNNYLYAYNELMSADKLAGVIISSAWTEPYSEINEIAELITDKGLRAIVVGENMEFYRDIPDIVLSSVKLDAAAEVISILQARNSNRTGDLIRSELNEAVGFINLYDFQCQPDCDVLDASSRLLYLDSNHITSAGGELFGARLRQNNPDLF